MNKRAAELFISPLVARACSLKVKSDFPWTCPHCAALRRVYNAVVSYPRIPSHLRISRRDLTMQAQVMDVSTDHGNNQCPPNIALILYMLFDNWILYKYTHTIVVIMCSYVISFFSSKFLLFKISSTIFSSLRTSRTLSIFSIF